MLKKALSGLEPLRKSGLPGAVGSPSKRTDVDAEELGAWHYLVTDTSGIRPRQEPCYSKDTKDKCTARVPAGSMVNVRRRLKSGWTRWLELEQGGWLFDISPKDRKVRMIEVELQSGSWSYEACVAELSVLAKPLPASRAACKHQCAVGSVLTCVERVRPLVGRGAYLKISELDGWVLDFVDGSQILRRKETDGEALSPCAIRTAVDDDGFLDDDAQSGEWRYIVVDPKGMTLRSRPTYDKSAKLQARVEEGEIVGVLERREGAETVFLRVQGSDGIVGWAFTTQPGEGAFLRLLEVEIKQGRWHFQVVAPKGCPVRTRCSLASNARKAAGCLHEGQLVLFRRRVEVGNTLFLGLDDGSWIACPKDEAPPVVGPLEVHKMNNEEAEIQAEGGVSLRKAPTQLPWALTKQVLLEGSKVLAIRRARVDSNMWMEVMQLGGLSGWILACDLQLELDVSSRPRWCR
eukprot:TRINITY_DN9340_c0_g1_i1.p1 TRINITY_DN9340_c0_g1~~TRINITY_DN9340_c0_g1_i1.p1  ORF type:complete len:478 (+),score=71.05 TRINITY_DN9340_c0_g1_i1:51-1436(+)